MNVSVHTLDATRRPRLEEDRSSDPPGGHIAAGIHGSYFPQARSLLPGFTSLVLASLGYSRFSIPPPPEEVAGREDPPARLTEVRASFGHFRLSRKFQEFAGCVYSKVRLCAANGESELTFSLAREPHVLISANGNDGQTIRAPARAHAHTHT